MTVAPDRNRTRVHLHLMRRVLERQLPFDHDELVAMEREFHRCRVTFMRPGKSRYRLPLDRDGERFMLVFCTKLRCIVTAWRVA